MLCMAQSAKVGIWPVLCPCAPTVPLCPPCACAPLQAIHQFEEVVRLAPSCPWPHLNLADCLRCLGKNDEVHRARTQRRLGHKV